MILDDFLVFTDKGLYCSYGDFYLDATSAVACAIISHAHNDHVTKNHQFFYATASTIALVKSRLGKNAAKEFCAVPFYQAFTIKDVVITLIPAGHILGSAQILMSYKGVRYLYTGDCKLQKDATCEPYEFVQADVLITETTYARPEVLHPPVEQEIDKLNKYSATILLGAYALGKSQRLIRLINDYCPQKNIVVHHNIAPLNYIYESFDIHLGNWQLYQRKMRNSVNEHLVYIVPPMTFGSYIKNNGAIRMFATGWHYKKQGYASNAIQISDHIDWNDLQQIITETKCTEIWTLHGDGQYLQYYFGSDKRVKILQ